MRRAARAAAHALLLAGGLGLMAACGGLSKSQIGGALLPKGPAAPGGPSISVTLVPAPTHSLQVPPSIGLTPWPAPFTYGGGTPPPTAIPAPAEPIAFSDDVVNILLLGSDRRSPTGSSRTDVILLLSLHPSSGAAALISFPRDLYVYLPGYTMNRVNTAWLYGDFLDYPGGGPAMLKDTMLYNFGLRIDHYALVDMAGFREIIDSVDGVEVEVACAYTDWRLKRLGLSQNDPDNWALYTVSAGEHHMDGEFALWYARSRARSSDFDRSRRQHEVLRAFVREAIGLGWILHIPDVWGSLNHVVTTDLALPDLLALAPSVARIDLANVRSRFVNRQEVTGWRVPTSGAAVLLPHPDLVRALLDDAFAFEAPDLTQPQETTTVQVVGHPEHPDWANLASERLTYAGFGAYAVDGEGAAPRATTLIEAQPGPADLRERLRLALGLSPAAVLLQPEVSAPFPYRLVLGDDYRPCFDPSQFRSAGPPVTP